jgi:hypothetical protein
LLCVELEFYGQLESNLVLTTAATYATVCERPADWQNAGNVQEKIERGGLVGTVASDVVAR